MGGMSAFVDGGKEFYQACSGQPMNAAEIQDSIIMAGAGADLHTTAIIGLVADGHHPHSVKDLFDSIRHQRHPGGSELSQCLEKANK